MPENTQKRVPKGDIKFSISLSEEQKLAKAEIRNHPFSFITGKAGSGNTASSTNSSRFFFQEGG